MDTSESNLGSGSRFPRFRLDIPKFDAMDVVPENGDNSTKGTYSSAFSPSMALAPESSIPASNTHMNVLASSLNTAPNLCPSGYAMTSSGAILLPPIPSTPTRKAGVHGHRAMPYHTDSLVGHGHMHSPMWRRKDGPRSRLLDLSDGQGLGSLPSSHSMDLGEISQLREELGRLRRANDDLQQKVSNAQRACQEQEGKILAQDLEAKAMKDLLDCPVCMSPFEKPYFLSCGHTFCLNCIQSWFLSIQQTQPPTALLHCNNCPVCRTLVLLPSPAFLIQDLVERCVANGRIERPKPRTGASSTYDLEGGVLWQGIFEEELEACQGCGGLARYGECLGYAGVFGRDSVVGFSNTNDFAQAVAQGDLNGIPHSNFN